MGGEESGAAARGSAVATAEGGMPSSMYLRRSSGLVRVGGPWSSFAFNFIFTGNSIGIIAAFILSSYVFVAPGQNIPGLIILATALSIFVPATYALFSIIMPRSGGDYHYIGRTLHPSLGFMSSFSWAIWLAIVIGWACKVVVPIGLQSTLAAWGAVTGDQGLVNLGNALNEPLNIYAIGALIILIFAAVQLAGTRVYFVAQNIAFALMLLTLAITIGVLVTTTPQAFAARVDALFGAGSYENLLTAYRSNVALNPPTVSQTLSGLALWAGIATWTMGTSIIAGEIKNVKKSMLIGNLFSIVALGLTFALTAFLYFNAFGSDFIYAASYLNGSPDYPLTIPPYYNAFIGLMIDNPVLFLLFSVGFFLGGIWFIPQNIMLASRNMLAWSFDRLFPQGLGRVDARFRTPYVAIIVTTVIALVSLWVYVFTNWLGFFSQLFAVAFSFLLTGIAAIVFPFVKKEMFEASPVRWRLGPVPVMSLVGLGNVVFMAVFLWQNYSDSTLGSNSPVSLGLIAGTFVAGFVLFWVIRAIRKTQAIDLDMLYKELPPE